MNQPKNMTSKINNHQGKIFEKLIEMGCQKYELNEKAFVQKIPENFHPQKIDKVTKKATGYYKESAQPDFQGTLSDGRSICFEAKYTNKEMINQSVVSKFQAECLSKHKALGAYCGVCCQVNKTIAFIPWGVWENMKDIYGRKYMTEDEVKIYQVPVPMYVDFLYFYHLGVC
ncbi:Holliday junction resolvase RecU [Jeotgalibaca porci]|uniref:Holliday junction resolvase RecU n=1 Tax=Jeotgalibaca porci TaxID=1868793 RepID=UPI0035A0D647